MANTVEITATGRDAGAKATLTAGAKAGDELKRSIGGAREVARGLLAAGFIQDIGRQAQQFLGQASAAAAGLEQAVGGTSAVFGDASGAIDEFARNSAQKVGLSEAAFRDATTLIGGQLKRMTGDVGLAADASIQLVEVGADLAATYGGTTREAVDAFAAALRGEADPAERFNLNLKVSAINAKAVELGLAASEKEVDDNAKAQALLALVMEQSADAQGQFAREADTAAVAQQKAAAEWENAKAVLGGALLPVLGQASNAVSTLASGFADLPQPAQTAVAAVAALAAGLLIVLPRIAAAKVALAELGITARVSGTRMGALAGAAGRAVGPIGLLAGVSLGLEATVRRLNPDIEALAVGLERWAQTGEAGGEAAKLLGSDFDKLNEALVGAADEGLTRVLATMAEGVAPFTKNIDSSLARAVERVEAVDAALAQLVQSGRGQEAAEVFAELARRAEENGISQEKLVEILPEYAAAQEVANSDTQNAADAQEDAAGATEEHIGALEQLRDTLKAQTDPLFAFTRAQREVRDAQKAVKEAEDEFTRNSPEYEAAVLDLAEAKLGLFDATTDAAGSMDGSLLPALRRARDAGILSKEEFRSLRDAIRAVDKQDARVTVRDNANQAKRRMQQLKRSIDNVDRFVDITFRTHGAAPVGSINVPKAHGGISGAQSGGPRSRRTLVGEAGPELVDLAPGSFVHTAGATRAMLEAGSYSRDEFTDREWRLLMSGGVAAYMRHWDQQFGHRASEAFRELERQRVTNTLEAFRQQQMMVARSPAPAPQQPAGGQQLVGDVLVQVFIGDERIEPIVKRVTLRNLRTDAGHREDVRELVVGR